MSDVFASILNFLKDALVKKFVAEVADNLLKMLIDWLEGLIRQRAGTAQAAAA